jgi:hypothetical protein
MSSIEIIVPGGVTDFGGGPIDFIPDGSTSSESAFRVSPNLGRQGQFLYVTAIRETSGWDVTTIMSFSGTGITVHTTVFITDAWMVGTVSIAPDAPLGFRNVVMSTGLVAESIVNGFEVTRNSTGGLPRKHPKTHFPSPKNSARAKLAEIVRDLREQADEEALLRLL